MRREDLTFTIFGAAGLAILVGTMMFGDQSWWPSALKAVKTHRAGTVLGAVIVAVAILGWAQMGVMRSRSPQLLAENIRWSHNHAEDRPIPAGDFLALPVGGIHVGGFNFRGKDGTVIVHKDAARTYGTSLLLLAKVEETDFAELPPAVRSLIRKRGLRAPFYFGWAPSFVELRTRDFSGETRKLALAHRQIHIHEVTGLESLRALQMKVRVLTAEAAPKGGVSRIVGRLRGGSRNGDHGEDEQEANYGD